jgi:hypothetical protein
VLISQRNKMIKVWDIRTHFIYGGVSYLPYMGWGMGESVGADFHPKTHVVGWGRCPVDRRGGRLRLSSIKYEKQGT